jgi:hypothetical protein
MQKGEHFHILLFLTLLGVFLLLNIRPLFILRQDIDHCTKMADDNFTMLNC